MVAQHVVMAFSCNSSFKDIVWLFDYTVYIVLSEQCSSGKVSICANIQIVLMPSSKSFGDKYEKCTVLFMEPFLFTQFVLSIIIHTVCLTNFFQKEYESPWIILSIGWLIATLACATFWFCVKLSVSWLRVENSM